MLQTFYEILGIDRQADDITIRKAYQKKALESHPDRTNGTVSEFQQILQAYTVLSDPEQKRGYDYTLPLSPNQNIFELSLEEIYSGTKISLGSAVVNIPAGTLDRTKFKLKTGEIFTLRVIPHSTFAQGGPFFPNTTSQDIITKISTNRKSGILKFLDGKNLIWFFEGKNPIIIPEKGLAIPHSQKRGNLLIFVELRKPRLLKLHQNE